jgi:hypothetical protein
MAWPFNKKDDSQNTDNRDQSKAEIDSLVERLSASFSAQLEEKLTPIRTEVTGIKTKWENLEKVATAAADDGKNPDGSELTDDQKRQINERKLLGISIATNARITEMEILGEVSSQGLGEFLPRIREYFQNTTLERKGQADYATYCRNIVDMVLGAAARNGGLRFDGQNKRFFLEDAGGKNNDGQGFEFLAPDMSWTDPKTGKVLTGRQQLEKLGIKPEDFAKSVKDGMI